MTRRTSYCELESDFTDGDIPDSIRVHVLDCAKEILTRSESGDELWRYSMPGSVGLAIVRKGAVVSHLQIAMS